MEEVVLEFASVEGGGTEVVVAGLMVWVWVWLVEKLVLLRAELWFV